MTLDDFFDLVEKEVKGLSNYLEEDDYLNAINDAMRDTGWSFPVTVDFQLLWLKNRTKRHLFFYLMTESAHKFKYEQINLQHRFDHYHLLVKDMDLRFEQVKEDNPEEFLELLGITDTIGMLGTKVDAGFSYSKAGEDTTYTEANKVIFAPTKE